MPSYPRSRERVKSYTVTGSRVRTSWTKFGSTTWGPDLEVSEDSLLLRPTSDEKCDDYVSDELPYPDHALELVSRKAKFPSVKGMYGPIHTYGVFEKYEDIKYDRYTPAAWASLDLCPSGPPFVAWGYWMTKALANINPVKPHVDIPLFLFELREFPRMLRDLGRILQGAPGLRDIPGQHLAYQFGWAPMISDARKLLGLAVEIDNRLKRLRDAQDGQRIKRTLRNSTVFSTTSLPLEWDGFGVTHQVETRTKVWFVASPKLAPNWTWKELDEEVRSARTLLGFRGDARTIASTIWNTIPWTWLIDYFLNIGNLIESSIGGIPLELHHINLMYQEEKILHAQPRKMREGTTLEAGHYTTVSKLRHVAPLATPRLSFAPVLTNRQQGILGSLVMAKALSRSR